MRILLAQDGSGGAMQAAEMVRDIPWPVGSFLRVVSVIEPTMTALTAWGAAADAWAEVDSQISKYHKDELAETVRGLSGPNLTVESAVMRGRPATVIVDEARGFSADLIVMGSRGHGAITSLVLGSVSGEVVDQAPCPVLVARRPSISRLLFATDGSPSAISAEALLCEWPIIEGLPIRVLSVADVPPPWGSGIAPTMYREVSASFARDLADAKVDHQRMADESGERLRAAGRDAVAEMRVGDAAVEVIAAAVEFDADLVVVGSRGRTGLKRLLLGSVARNVLHGSAASILVVHDAARARVGR
jgi:nucleotide-binding universal stress UspA family protein